MKKELTTLCYVEKDGMYLLLHRTKKKDDINAGKYIGIGGHIEHNETPTECIIREAYEETGLKLNNPKLRGIITFVIDDYDEYTFLYTCDDFEGSLKECNEGELSWVDKDEIFSLPMWEGDEVFLRKLCEDDAFISVKLVYVNDELIDVIDESIM